MKKRLTSRKAQVSLFILVGVIIVASLIALYYQGIILPLPKEESQTVLSPYADPVRNFVADCVEEASVAGLRLIGRHAGYYDYGDLDVINFAGDKVVVVSQANGQFVNRLLPVGEIERQFSLYMLGEGYDAIDSCTRGFEAFPVSVSAGIKDISVEIKDSSVDINVDWPITIRKGRARLGIEQQNLKLQMRAGQVLRLANDIVNLEVSGEIFEGEGVEAYVKKSPERFEGVEFSAEHYPSYRQEIFMLRSSPSMQEEDFEFYFAVDRS